MELKTRSVGDRLFLAKIPTETTLLATAVAVTDRVRQTKAAKFEEPSSFVVPVLDFDVTRDYFELLGKPMQVKNPSFDGDSFEIARQKIRFKLDETGAVLKSEAIYAAAKAESLIFDEPFLIMIQRQNAKMPYFALWVDNAELLVPFEE